MSLESIGKLFFLKIRPLFFFALLICPLIAAALFLFFENEAMQELEMRFLKSARNERQSCERKERKERFLERYAHANPYFLDQEIEGFALLQEEKSKLQTLLQHPVFPGDRWIQERLAFLEKNRLLFTEESSKPSAKMKEVEEKQRTPVQMDEKDLQTILSILEDVPVGNSTPVKNSPQILIKDFRLKKHETALQTEVFEVEMGLLKREFTK